MRCKSSISSNIFFRNMCRNMNRDVNELIVRQSSKATLELREESGDYIEVTPVRCFPWKHSKKYISLRNKDSDEICLIKNLDSVSSSARQAIEQALHELDFVFKITKVISIEIEFEIRSWQVETVQGPYRFQTRLDEWPKYLSDHEILIQDVSNNLFKINNVSTLDQSSQKVLWPYLD